MRSSKRTRFSLILPLFFIAATAFSVELYEEKTISRILIECDSSELSQTCDPKAVLSKLKTKEGDHFSQFTFDDDLKSLSEDYDRVQPRVQVQDDQLVITIQLTARPKIHQIRITGNGRFSTHSLLKELDIKAGSTFHRQEFTKAFNKLKDLYIKKGYFESQLTYTLQPIPNTNEIDVLIEIKEGRSGNIQKIVFKGFSKQESGELSDQMYLKKYNFLMSWLTGSGKFRDEALEQDRVTIVNFLHNRGYADARVDIQLLENPVNHRIIVEITADRGVLYHAGSVTFEGYSLFPLEDIEKRSLIHEGDVFSPEKVRDSAQAIKDFYGQKGYIDTSVQYETPLHEEDPIFDIHFSVDEGEQFRIGMVHVLGNRLTKDNVILRESLLVPGDLFDSRKLKATQQRLEGVGYFKSVNVYAVRSCEDQGLEGNYRDVYIEVEEMSTGNVSLFMGFSSLDSVFGGLDLTERNFNIAGTMQALHGRVSSFRGGGQYFHSRLTVGKKEDGFLISWMNPYVNDTLWRLGVELSKTYSELQSNDDSAETKVRTYGGSVFTNYPLSTYWTAGARQRLRHTWNKLHLELPKDGIPTDSYVTAKKKNDGKGFLSAFSTNLTYDSTDSSIKPHSGWRSYAEAELAGVGGKFHFWKLSYLNSIYFPVTSHSTFKTRGEIRFISPFGPGEHLKNVPYSERLFMGGEGTVRGYKPFILGKKISYKYTDKEGKVIRKKTDTAEGGLTSCLLSAEYNYELLRMLDLFCFFDAGSVSSQTWTVAQLQSSVGAGIRLEINQGTPIVIGYGYPINPKHKERQSFFFSMGGQF